MKKKIKNLKTLILKTKNDQNLSKIQSMESELDKLKEDNKQYFLKIEKDEEENKQLKDEVDQLNEVIGFRIAIKMND